MNNLLRDPIFRVEISGAFTRLDLPGVLSALGKDPVESLPGLQRHQEDAFHILLCYLAAAVLARNAREDPIQDEHFWREGLLRLAEDNENAWKLVVEDPTQPAFMQVCVPNIQLFNKQFIPKAETPDELDLLQIAKNHDVKAQRAHRSDAETWVYSLISLQTMTGLMGRGNYGIARMNSGTGSRVRVEAVYEAMPAPQWRRNVKKLLRYRPDLLGGGWPYRDNGIVLTWLEPWDLQTALALSRLDPFFVEIARALRLVESSSGIQVFGGSSQGMRIAAKDSKGLLGDPWTPIVDDGKEQKAWTVMSRFTPKDLRDLVFSDDRFRIGYMQRSDDERAACAYSLNLSVLAAGGMGKTNGFYESSIRIPGTVSRSLLTPGPERDRLAARSKERLARAAEMQNKVLKPAIYSLLEAAPEKIDFDKREISEWVTRSITRYSETWALEYFPRLWRSLDQDDDAARLAWLEYLKDLAWAELQNAIDRLPLRSARGFRSRIGAETLFYGSLYKHFTDLKKDAIHDDNDPSRI